MGSATQQPLPPTDAPEWVQALPKADLHVHAEASARLDRVLARPEGRPSYDWSSTRSSLIADTPAGMARLDRPNGGLDLAGMEARDAEPENFIDRMADALEEAGAAGARLVELRCGRATILYPEFMGCFREAERRVQRQCPSLRAEPLICLFPALGRDELLDACCLAARQGLAGVDVIPAPYDAEADWTEIGRWAQKANAAGLGITVHAGEFATANIAQALGVPGIRRIGHAVYAASEPRLLELLARSGMTIEVCLTSNVVLGAVDSYEAHPIRRFIEAGIPIALNTDDPVRLATTIAKEYATAAALGFSAGELLDCTRNAFLAAFPMEERRAELLADIGTV